MGDGLFDDFGAEELGMALGFGEEVGLGEQEDRRARKQNEADEPLIDKNPLIDEEPMSLEEHKRSRRVTSKRRRKPAPRGSFEEWVRLVIDGEIDPYDVDMYPYRRSFYDDPM